MQKVIKAVLATSVLLSTVSIFAGEEVSKTSGNLEAGATVGLPSLPKISMPDLPDFTKLLDGATTEAIVVKDDNNDELKVRYENVLVRADDKDVGGGLFPVDLTLNVSKEGGFKAEEVTVGLARMIVHAAGFTYDLINVQYHNDDRFIVDTERFTLINSSLTEKLKVKLRPDGTLKLILRGKAEISLDTYGISQFKHLSSNPDNVGMVIDAESGAGVEYKNFSVIGYLNAGYLHGSDKNNTRLYGEDFKRGIEVRYELTPHLKSLDTWGVSTRVKAGVEKREQLLVGDLGAREKKGITGRVSFEADFGKVSENKHYKSVLALDDKGLLDTLIKKEVTCDERFSYFGGAKEYLSLTLLSGQKISAEEIESFNASNRDSVWGSDDGYFKKRREENAKNYHKIAENLRLLIKSGRCIARNL